MARVVMASIYTYTYIYMREDVPKSRGSGSRAEGRSEDGRRR